MAKSIDHNNCQLHPQYDDCLTTDRIQAMLEDSLSPMESAVVEDHLSTCEHCRTQLEAKFGVPEWWSAAKESLSESSLQESVKHEDSSHPTDWKQLLGPTDDPRMLGRIGTYEVVGVLGRGGMGVVFKAFDGALNRYVAIKMLAPHLASSGAARKRFAREAQAAAAVIDDNVLPIYGVDQWQGVPYFVMQYSRGMTLQKRIQEQGPLALPEILRIGMQTAKGLAAAHAQGLVHRDVKPSNILLDDSVERVLLSDFGLARAVDDASLTRTGTIAGTPQYMAPEQVSGGTVDARCDLFSLGCVLYAVSTGRPPFRAESSYAILRQITDHEPRPIRQLNPEIPDWFAAIVAKLMAKSPTDRFASATKVAELLEHCLAHVQQPMHSPLSVQVRSLVGSNNPKTVLRLAPIGAAAVAAAILSLVAFFALFGAAPKVEGKWHDEAWGEITITPSTPGEYDGTFSGLDGKAKGIIRMRWSRKEGRFNGTWSDGALQSGRISLSPTSEGDIRGAITAPKSNDNNNWETSPPESKLGEHSQPHVASGPEQKWFKSERPRLGDFLWTRMKPAANASANSPSTKVPAQTVPDSWFRRDPYKELSKSPENPAGHIRIALELAAWEPAQSELELSAEQRTIIADLQIMSLPSDPLGTVSETTTAARKKVLAILKPEQQARLDQLVWQRLAYEGFETPALQVLLNLSKEQKQGIRQAFVDHKQRTLLYDAGLAELRQSGKADAQQLATAANDRAVLGIASLKKAWDVVYLLLTEKQREKYEKLRGPLIKAVKQSSSTGSDPAGVDSKPNAPAASREALQQQLAQEKAKFPLYDSFMAGENALSERLMHAENSIFADREAFIAANPKMANEFQQWQRDFRSMLRAKEIVPSLTKQKEHRPLMLWAATFIAKEKFPGSNNPALAKLREALPEKPSEEQLLQFLCDAQCSDLGQYEGALERLQGKFVPSKEQEEHCRQAEMLRTVQDIQTMYVDYVQAQSQIIKLQKELEEAQKLRPGEETPLTHEDIQAQEARVREASRKLRDPNAVLLGELQGTWTLTAMVLPDGKLGTVTKPAETGVMIRFDDKSGYMTQGTGDEGGKFTYVVDATTSPAEIDLKYPNGTYALGLITIKDGTLELQLGAGGDARPSPEVKPSIHQLYRRTKVYWQWIPARE